MIYNEEINTLYDISMAVRLGEVIYIMKFLRYLWKLCWKPKRKGSAILLQPVFLHAYRSTYQALLLTRFSVTSCFMLLSINMTSVFSEFNTVFQIGPP